ncbi:hypothetical protein IEQ34_027077 [Dendrobium chrysotoxum]|uniref:Uncharacterized protein n=1 Tax=Dendrobium chrysotoxum TaxID=161865 RepID=A0AAV7FG20_DENCH|nr:hypothetical protein IEQ34_027077 [Dendrobium chrysotoxum]
MQESSGRVDCANLEANKTRDSDNMGGKLRFGCAAISRAGVELRQAAMSHMGAQLTLSIGEKWGRVQVRSSQNRHYLGHECANYGRNRDGHMLAWFRMCGSTSWGCGFECTMETEHEWDWAHVYRLTCGVRAMEEGGAVAFGQRREERRYIVRSRCSFQEVTGGKKNKVVWLKQEEATDREKFFPKENMKNMMKNIKYEKAKKELPHELHKNIKPKKMTNEMLMKADQVKHENMSNINSKKQEHEEQKKKKSNLENAIMATPYLPFISRPGIR